MFSKSTEYALRAVIFIAKWGSPQNKISIDRIAQAIDSPKSFTAKILQKLTRDNVLISSITGPNGGFYLSEEAKDSTLMKVLELLDEDHVITKCVLGLQECSESNPCPMHSRYKLIKPQLTHMFSNKTIRDLVHDLEDTNVTLTNAITLRKKI
ncbi:MAG: Rrf2 family transcriptional regulator [Saprospiraceae bacterium]|nr:Rrf2 family transcriptional regulator [Saprospiraceae bacterium]